MKTLQTRPLIFLFVTLTLGLTLTQVQGQCSGQWTIIRQSNIRPPNISENGIAYFDLRSNSLMFAGSHFQLPNRIEVWRLDGEQWTFVSQAPFPRRFEFFAAYDTNRQALLLFGGNSGQDFWYDELWQFDGSVWSLLHSGPDGPGARSAGAAAFDEDRDRLVIFGGAVPVFPGRVGDTWEWDGATWTQVATSGPQPRHLTRAAYDLRRHEVVLFGGNRLSGGDVLDTWTWNGLKWTQRATNGPFNRTFNEGHLRNTTYDARRGRIVMVSVDNTGNTFPSRQAFDWDGQRWIAGRIIPGANNNQGIPFAYYDELAERVRVLNPSHHWQYTGPLPAPEIDGVAYAPDAALGSRAEFQSDVFAIGTLSFEWSKDGSPLINGGRVSGADTATLVVDPALSEDAGTYQLTVSNECGMGTSELLPMTVFGTPPLAVSPDPLHSGQDATFTGSFLTANEPTYLAYSVRGLGSVFFPPLNITIDLLRPKQIGPVMTTNINGEAQWVLHVPPIGNPVPIWFQVVQFENKTNVVETQIEP